MWRKISLKENTPNWPKHKGRAGTVCCSWLRRLPHHPPTPSVLLLAAKTRPALLVFFPKWHWSHVSALGSNLKTLTTFRCSLQKEQRTKYLDCAFRGFLWCRRTGTKRKDFKAYLLFFLFVSFVSLVVGIQILLLQVGRDQRGRHRVSSSFFHTPLLMLAPIHQLMNFSFFGMDIFTGKYIVVTHNGSDETVGPLVWSVWITRGWRPCGRWTAQHQPGSHNWRIITNSLTPPQWKMELSL